jgi:hypothetical protein
MKDGPDGSGRRQRMAILIYTGRVGTNKVGSDCEFEFEIDTELCPTSEPERTDYIDKGAQEAMWESGIIDWSYQQVEES